MLPYIFYIIYSVFGFYFIHLCKISINMKNKINLLILTLLITVASCKKYEEGPSISLRSAKSRVEGKWNVTSHIRDNREIINIWDYDNYRIVKCKSNGQDIDKGGPGVERYKIYEKSFEFKKDGELVYTSKSKYEVLDFDASENQCVAVWIDKSDPPYQSKSKWELDENKENIVEDINGTKYQWKIIMLKDKKMKIRYEKNGKFDEYTMEKM